MNKEDRLQVRYGNYFQAIYNRTGRDGTIARKQITMDIGAPESFCWMAIKTGYIKKSGSMKYAIDFDKLKSEDINDFFILGGLLAKCVRDYNNLKKNKNYPTVKDVIEFFSDNGYPLSLAEKFKNFYDDRGWVQKNGNKIKNWKNVARNVWFENYDKKYNKTSQLEINLEESKKKEVKLHVDPINTGYVSPEVVEVEAVPQKRIKLLWGLIDITI